jgi:septal ring factor EnvC (AmiA/AmiB activator)
VVVNGSNLTLPQSIGRPMTLQDVQLLQNRRSELSRQLNSATGRRQDVIREMGRSPNGREGLEARLKVLDQRIVQLETDIAQNGQLLASAPPNLVEETTPQMNFGPPVRSVNGTLVSMTAIIAVAVVVTTITRRVFARRPAASPAISAADTERIARIEQAVESIAVEVERISEGQRFVTKLMSEPRQLGVGAAQPIAVRQGDPVRLERSDADTVR